MSLENSVGDWFFENLAERLNSSGLKTISELVRVVLDAPGNWYIDAPGISGVGASKALRITSMLEAHLGSLTSIAHRVGVQSKPNRPNLPIYALPAKNLTVAVLDQVTRVAIHKGANEKSAIAADTDFDAMKTWLSLKASPLTVTLYQREVVRLISWALRECNKTLPDLTVEDAIKYREALCTGPDSPLVKKGPQRGFKKLNQAEGTVSVAGFTKAGLSPSSVKKSLVIVSGFFSWLVSVQHTQANPFAAVKMTPSLPGISERSTRSGDLDSLAHAAKLHETVTDRTLPTEAIQSIRSLTSQSQGEMMDDEARIRVSFIFELAIQTGLRISELAAARLDHLNFIDATNTDGGWMLKVVGKRAKPREVPFPPLLVETLRLYLVDRGIIDSTEAVGDAPIGTFMIGSLPSVTPVAKRADGIRSQAIHTALKRLFALASQHTQFSNPKSVSQLQRSTTHWLRHTAATRAVAAEVPLDVVASTLGHASLTTTSRYVRADQFRKMAEMNRLWDAIPKSV